MFYDKPRDDPPCVTKNLTASDDYLYDDEPTLDESIHKHALFDYISDSLVKKHVGTNKIVVLLIP
jgi:hypothetical protein